MSNGIPPPVPAKAPTKHWNLGVGPILAHSFNADRSMLAVSSAETIYVFHLDKGEWNLLTEIHEHDLHVTCLDWAAKTNRLVSGSHDKNSFVFTVSPDNVFKPELVLVRALRGITSCKWSPLENKFAIGTHCKTVAVCFYEKENDWWISKHIKKDLQSTVKCLDWHPNNVLLAVGTTDFKVYVFSGYCKEVDEKPAPNPWGSKLPFGILLAEFTTYGWVRSLAFSPSGNQLAWTTHAAEISVVNKANGGNEAKPETVRHQFLPFNQIMFTDENTLLAIGHEFSPVQFKVENGKPKYQRKIDIPSAEKNESTASAFKMFRSIDRTAAQQTADDGKPKTLHQNTVTNLRAYASGPKGITKFTTVGLDGQLVLWDLKD
ncbi:unnamed protein product [Bursaphelenchus xylophilus]|uniref:Actin-related protein 2/3 complex subunit n=1 Tax=Bursaphelenchus xylophilus TaxID=6326 RepID=A0A1I7RZG0_BURXY|nr:unnamed protein product [Bursaphelenchus xylophilus]CAG9106449.1 unnamed protein product [Bursaphelenchus xylophilus]